METETKEVQQDVSNMVPKVRSIIGFLALVVTTLNVEKVTQAHDADSWLALVLRDGPTWASVLYGALTERWMLFLAGLYLGGVANNWLIGLHGRYTGRHGQVPLWWVRRRMFLVRRLIDKPTLTALVDLARELHSLDRELTAPGLALPGLPTTDPHDTAEMRVVRYYVTVVAPLLRKRTLSEARSAADAIVLHRLT